MTPGTVLKEAFESRNGSAIEDLLIADKKDLNDLKTASSIEEPVNFHQTKVLDEEFRLAVKKTLTGIATLPDNWNDLTVREQRDWVYLKIKDHCTNLPDSLLFLCVGSTINGDCEQAFGAVPEWLDREKFERGQRFAMDNYAAISFAEMLSLYTLFSFGYGLKPLIITGKSGDPFTSFKRYLSTGIRVRNWYSSDVWTPGTEAHRDMQTVRKMHANIRKKLYDMSYLEIDEAATMCNTWSNDRAKICEDFRGSCQAPAPGQCPYMFTQEEQFKRPKGLNQSEMASTQFGFMGLVILYPERFGIHGASDEDLDAYCHVWRGLGYLLGIEDEFNFCKGTFEEVKQRSGDFLEYWVKPNLREVTPEWEHMMRCVMEGIKYYLPTVTYEHCLLYLADIINVPMPRLRASLNYVTWFRLMLLKFTFKWTARFPGVLVAMNRRVIKSIDRAIEYTDEELAELRKRSEITLSEGIAKTIEAKKDLSMAARNAWKIAPFFVFSSALLLLNLSIIVKEYARKVMHFGAASVLPS